MATKIIPFRPRVENTNATPTQVRPTAAERAERLPEWSQALDVEWIFQEAERRQTGRAR